MKSDYETKIIYWSNGKIKRETPYYKGKKQGTERNYDYQGILVWTVDYCDNLINGFIKTYFKSGMIESEQLYKNGEPIDNLIIHNEYNEHFHDVYNLDGNHFCEIYDKDDNCFYYVPNEDRSIYTKKYYF
jgi:antitoxin component YwqK of YwqJK toxin-antitoxin module